MSQSAINKKILTEIDSLKTENNIKKFLKELLSIELDQIGQGRPQYLDKYKEKMEEIF